MTRNTTKNASHPLRLAASVSLFLVLPLGGCIKGIDLDDGDTEGSSGAEASGAASQATSGTEEGGTGNVSGGSAAEGGEATVTTASETEGGDSLADLCAGFCVWENTCNAESDPECVAACIENYDAYADLDAACNQAMHEWTACVSMVQGCDISECSVWAYALQTCEDNYSCAGGEGGGDGGAGEIGSCQWERSCGDGPVYAMSCAEGTCSCTIDGEPTGECVQGMTICDEGNLDGLEQAMNECCGFEG